MEEHRMSETIGKEKLDYIIETVKKQTETDAVILKLERGETNLCSSKIGGYPYWPTDREYPTDSQGNPLILLAQINLSDFEFHKLPHKGLLQFFVANDDIMGLDNAKGYKVVYHGEIDTTITEDEIHKQGIPSNLDFQDNNDMWLPTYQCFSLSFSVQKDWLGNLNDGFDEIVNDILKDKYGYQYDKGDDWWEFLSKEDCKYLEDGFSNSTHKMFGYPFFTQSDPRDNDPMKEQYDTLLFQLDSECDKDTGIEIMIGDCGVMNFFINGKALENLNFEDVLYNWDCY